MKIFVGVHASVSEDSGWWRVIEQEKIPFVRVEGADAPIILFEESTPSWVSEYVENGGTAVGVGARPSTVDFDHVYCGECCVQSVQTGVDDIGTIELPCVASLFAGDGLGEFRMHQNRLTKGNIRNGRFPIIIRKKLGRGNLFYTGLPLTRLLMVVGDRLRTFAESQPITERVTFIEKWKISRLLVWLLQTAFHVSGFPYVQLWYYPKGMDTAFSFRIDGDGLFGENLDMILQAADSVSLPLTIFLNREMCSEESSRFSSISASHYVGNHAHIHNLFDTQEENMRNIKECEVWLDSIGIAHGPWFAAPRGMWNFALGLSLEELGFDFSSDFGYDIDSFPFFPRFRGRKMNLLQIPIHPYSVERDSIFCDEQGRLAPTATSVLAYFTKMKDFLAHRHLPINYYSHPEVFGPMAAQILPSLVRIIREDPSTIEWSLPEFASWWKQRDVSSINCDYDQSTGGLALRAYDQGGAASAPDIVFNVVSESSAMISSVGNDNNRTVVHKNRIQSSQRWI